MRRRKETLNYSCTEVQLDFMCHAIPPITNCIKVEDLITDDLSLIGYWKFIEKSSSMCMKIRMRKNAKNKKINLKNEYFIQYKCRFFIQTHSNLINSPTTISFSTPP